MRKRTKVILGLSVVLIVLGILLSFLWKRWTMEVF